MDKRSVKADTTGLQKIYRVIKDYQLSNADPFSIMAGETFHVSEKVDSWDGNADWIWVWCTDQRGKSGWVPKNIIDFHADCKNGTARFTYSARELTVAIGDELTGNYQESGWLWGTNQQGENGWVPLNCLSLLT